MSFNIENPPNIFSLEGLSEGGELLEATLKTTTSEILTHLIPGDTLSNDELLEIHNNLLSALETSLLQTLEGISEDTGVSFIYPENLEIS